MTTLAVDIGGTKIAAARVLDDGTVVEPVMRASTPAAGGGRVVVDAVIALLRSIATAEDTAIGISSAGVIDTEHGVVAGATANIAEWTGVPLGPLVSQAMALPVTVIGDGHAFALGESQYGAAKGYASVLELVAGTGIGGSVIVDGRVLHGAHWAGGHVGHIAVPGAEGVMCTCGVMGHLEGIAGGLGIVNQYHRLGGDSAVTSVEELPSHDPLAGDVIAASGAAIGTVLGGLCNVVDPAIVVVAGGLTRLGEAWATPIRANFEAALMPALSGLPLVVSESGSSTALQGAAYAARRVKEVSHE